MLLGVNGIIYTYWVRVGYVRVCALVLLVFISCCLMLLDIYPCARGLIINSLDISISTIWISYYA